MAPIALERQRTGELPQGGPEKVLA
jgi:hypothetical protein